MFATENLTKRYGETVVLQPLSMTIAVGSSTALIGPSGCGKSTLLRLLIGLIAPTSGSVSFNGRRLEPASAQSIRHQVGYVTQDGGLFPHLSAGDNVTLLAKHLHRDSSQIRDRVAELAGLVQLPMDALKRFPASLSGGQRQRVSLMRALMLDPDVLLLDEPLGALDPIRRRELQTELRGIFDTLKKTVVFVTHDMGEAAYFGDTIVLMRDGAVVQQGPLQALLNAPAQPYVTEFIHSQRSLVPELETTP